MLTMVQMFSVDTKRRMYAAVVNHLEAAGLRHGDRVVSVVKVSFEDRHAGRPLSEQGGQR